ncbi:Alpha/Beta hydrolase protein [Phaeosphaeriaceae sp. PMI808]|nr:Alpha/Beta hydrolase protein [Phaeosphaeriaceae sp. PMI808]
MASILIVAAIAIISKIPRSHANPTTDFALERPHTSAAHCVDYVIPIAVASENLISNLTKFRDNFDLVDFIFEYVRKDSNVTFHPWKGSENVTASYEISGTFCSPKTPAGNGREKTVLLTTHGLAYDRRYWDSTYKPDEYSFVEAMINEGYSIFFYDRLGTGRSQVISGYINQAEIQVEIIATLASLIRDGSYTGTIGKPKKLVLVGHSYGSYTSNLAVAKYPKLADATVLTGMAYAGDSDGKKSLEAMAPRIASSLNPDRFSQLDTGYVLAADIYTHINTFFKAPAYEADAARHAYSINAPLAVTEYLSIATKSPVAPNFEGAVLVTTGEFDFLACDGECYSSFAKQRLDMIFPKSRFRETFVHPDAGHAINFATNATGFYEGISKFLQRAGF